MSVETEIKGDMSYEILHHTADIKFRAKGPKLEEAFSEAVKAFSELVKEGEKMEFPESDSTQHTVEIESENAEALFFDFLDRLIYIQDVNNVTVTDTEEMEITQDAGVYKLKASVVAYPIPEEMPLLDIKGPTYNDMIVEKTNGEWVLEAVLDI